MAESIVRAVNAGIDLSFTIATSNWSSTSPYTYTWTSDKINAKSRITVEYYGTPATEASVGYIEYEKVAVTGGYGVKFTSPVLPTVGISVIVHILSSQAIRLESITGDMVQTSSISGAANVNEALTALNSKISTFDLLWQGDLHTIGQTFTLSQSIFNYKNIIFVGNAIPSRSPQYDYPTIPVPNILIRIGYSIDIYDGTGDTHWAISFSSNTSGTLANYHKTSSDYSPGIVKIYGSHT